MGDDDKERGILEAEAKCMWETSVPFSQFCWEPKTNLKNNVYLKK